MEITSGASTITPDVILGYESESESGNIVHPILGRSEPDVTLRPAGLRTGTLKLGFHGATSEADSRAAEELHRDGTVFLLTTDDRETVDMTYVVAGRIRRALEETTRRHWTVDIDFQEV